MFFLLVTSNLFYVFLAFGSSQDSWWMLAVKESKKKDPERSYEK